MKEEDETGSPESKKLKLKISHGKVVSSSIDKVRVHYTSWCNHGIMLLLQEDSTVVVGSDDDPTKGRNVKEQGEELIVQIKLQDTSALSTQDESWKPKRDKQRKDYAELFGQRKKLTEEEKEKMIEIYDLIVNEKVRLIV